MARLTALIALLVCFSACSGSPTSPSSTFTLSGTVSDVSAHAIAGASVTIMDGPHAGLSRTTDSAGNYSFTDLPPSAFTLQARSGFLALDKTVNLTANQSVYFQLVNYCAFEPYLSTLC